MALFRLQDHGTTARSEIRAGATTWLAMAYIVAVNPAILGKAGIDPGAVFTATCVPTG
jgi:AGZA family xanthine/uracil permease-like MFS transporter